MHSTYRSSEGVLVRVANHSRRLKLRNCRFPLGRPEKRRSPQERALLDQAKRPIEIRVECSLQRLGYKDVHVSHIGNGHVNLTGTIPAGELSLVIAAIRCVPGVTKISRDL